MRCVRLLAAGAFISVASASAAQTKQPSVKHLACLAWQYSANDEVVEGSRKFFGVHFRDALIGSKAKVEILALEDPSATFVGNRAYLTLPDSGGKGFNLFWTDDAGIKSILGFERVGEKLTQYTEDWSVASARMNKKDQVIKEGAYVGNCVLVRKIEGYEIIRDEWLKGTLK